MHFHSPFTGSISQLTWLYPLHPAKYIDSFTHLQPELEPIVELLRIRGFLYIVFIQRPLTELQVLIQFNSADSR
jgi:hypothetical protein